MKKLITTITLILFAINLMATVYWVSPTGTDAATGRTRSAAWQTLDKVSAEMQTGDIIRFKRSATWNDTLFVNASSIQLIAWGEGKEPVIQFVYIDTLAHSISFQNITVTDFIYPEPIPDTTPPELLAFSIPSTASALTVAISTLTATDDVGVTGYFINETTTAPLPDAEGWTELAPANYTFATEGAKTLYAWAKDSSGNVSDSLVDMVTITLPVPDTEDPTVTAFVIPATSESLTVDITTFTATDNISVTGYKLTESATAPLSGDAGWTGSPLANYTFDTEGTKTLYAWVKDAAGNVSTSLNDGVVITLPVEPETYPIDYTGTVYYISATGNDANNGLTEETPKAFTAASSLNPGADGAVLLESSGDYVGTITPGYSGTSGNPVTYGAYGSTASKPVILGSQVLTGWTQRGSSNIYVKYITSTVTQLFEDDIRMTEARYPNTGYDYIETVNSTTSFTSTDLNASIDYTGAKWLGRTELYKMSTKTISASSGQTLSFATAPDGGLTVTTEGFILVGLVSLLDAAGEWCYNAANDTLYFWSPTGADPDTYTVRATTEDFGININSKNYVTVKDIEFKHQSLAGVYLYNADYITIDGNSFENQDATAIGSTALSASNYLTISNNNIKGANHYGMELYSSYSTVTDNVVDSTALFANLGGSGMGAVYAGSSYYIEGANGYNDILYNKSLNSGYNGIHFYGGHTTVEYNYLYNSMLTKDDGGAIYTSSAISPGGSVIRYNIVDGSYGTFNGYFDLLYTLGEGIYLDESSDSVTVNNNVVANIAGGAFYQHKGGYHNWNNNISYRAKDGFVAKLRGIGSVFTNNKVYGFSRDLNDRQSERMANFTSVADNPTLSNNTYVNHYKSTDVFCTFVSPTETTYSLAGWQAATSQDLTTTIDVAALIAGYEERLIYNETKSAVTYYLNNATNVIDAFSNASVTASFTLAPFTGKVLEGENLDCILTASDSSAPTVSSFIIPSTSSTAVITISTFVAIGTPTAYKITESNTAPELDADGWTSTAPATYGVSSNGEKTLYAWVRDAAGNISASASDIVTVSAAEVDFGFNTLYATNSTTTVRRAMPVTFTENGVIQSVSFYHGGGTGTCLVGVYADDGSGPAARLAISTETTLNVGASWNTVDLIEPLNIADGTKVWLAVTVSIGGLKYEAATPYRAQAASGDYTNGLPNPFGLSNQATGRYSIYCTYLQ